MTDDRRDESVDPLIRDVNETSAPVEETSILSVRLVLLLVGIVGLIVFIAQNDQNANVRFLWIEGSFSVSVLIMTSALLGAIIAILTTMIVRRRRRRAIAAAHESTTAVDPD